MRLGSGRNRWEIKPPKQTGDYLCSSVLTLFFSPSLKKQKENVYPSKILHAISGGSQALAPPRAQPQRKMVNLTVAKSDTPRCGIQRRIRLTRGGNELTVGQVDLRCCRFDLLMAMSSRCVGAWVWALGEKGQAGARHLGCLQPGGS